MVDLIFALLFPLVGAVIILVCLGVKVAFDSLNDLMYGEETMKIILGGRIKDAK